MHALVMIRLTVRIDLEVRWFISVTVLLLSLAVDSENALGAESAEVMISGRVSHRKNGMVRDFEALPATIQSTVMITRSAGNGVVVH